VGVVWEWGQDGAVLTSGDYDSMSPIDLCSIEKITNSLEFLFLKTLLYSKRCHGIGKST
jgi:hypothetical protein